MSYYSTPSQPGYQSYTHKGLPLVGTFQVSQASRMPQKRDSSYAEKRDVHNAVERQRRETLNTRFQELAQAIPTLATVRRPSKSIIVQKSLEFVHNTTEREAKHTKEIKILRQDNDLLFAEVNRLRQLLDQPLLNKQQQVTFSRPSTDSCKLRYNKCSKNGTEGKFYDPVLDETEMSDNESLTDDTNLLVVPVNDNKGHDSGPSTDSSDYDDGSPPFHGFLNLMDTSYPPMDHNFNQGDNNLKYACVEMNSEISSLQF